ncbi:FKBP-type peptidyl-prolyl cis-trans isomerase [Reichenbachiella agarivorans]|uniref:Peptidyl-prolyl cis-trans isomerase n=1 Tax=Reichenbachiella agarivorans TaxID=2979464 RepID=A0ABY6CPQ4_9BACT|nr:FKBP-type peptidyl-prolyl cis-trans isomerase [Reichenbachiella agarivorans]UXP32495.1 FKBP-type peptidyl-prolyl cis-trans isomerase [Reichenbachiella agarivorans]
MSISCLMFSCNQTAAPSKDLIYIKHGETSLVDSSMLVMNFLYKDENGNHLTDSATRALPLHMPYIKALWDTLGIFYTTLGKCNIGDSVHFTLSAKQLYIETFGETEIPAELKLSKQSPVNFYVGFTSQMSLDDFYHQQDSMENKRYQDYINDTEKRNIAQGLTIDQYLDKQGLKANKTESGLRYVITQEGMGDIPKQGDRVRIHFHGTLLNGDVFGSSYDSGESPYEFELGRGEVIAAWEEAVSLFKAGTKATLLVPSDLGFGYANRYDIPGSSILRYDIEIISVESAK